MRLADPFCHFSHLKDGKRLTQSIDDDDGASYNILLKPTFLRLMNDGIKDELNMTLLSLP
jgi:hypothetical protein